MTSLVCVLPGSWLYSLRKYPCRLDAFCAYGRRAVFDRSFLSNRALLSKAYSGGSFLAMGALDAKVIDGGANLGLESAAVPCYIRLVVVSYGMVYELQAENFISIPAGLFLTELLLTVEIWPM